ncbi:MAG: hypothetical protein UZ21_OP11001000454 [Microgenomates bacterium OLB22]|nr:MAG: hypothetical protein UZ21_OP11001000454 [Microgenomates bacterium OLB22]
MDGSYSENWLEQFKRMQSITGVPPTDEQLWQILSHLSKDRQYIGRSYSGISSAIDIAKKTFGIKPSPELVGRVYPALFQEGDLHSIYYLKSETGIAPQIPTEVIQARVDEVLKEGRLQDLYEVQRTLELEKVPVSQEIAQEMYERYVTSDTFGRDEVVTKAFYSLYELTGVRPQLTPELVAEGYKKTLQDYHFDFQEFEAVVGVPPTQDILQQRVLDWFTSSTWYRHGDKGVTQFIEQNNIRMPEEMVQQILLYHLGRKGLGTQVVEYIQEATGIEVKLTPELVAPKMEQILVRHKTSDIFCNDIIDLFDWYESYMGEPPPQRLIDLAYSLTFDQAIYKDVNREGNRERKKGWDVLRQRYGLPSPEAMQTVYLQFIVDDNQLPHSLSTNTATVENFSGVIPDMQIMVEIAQQEGLQITQADIENKLHQIYTQRLLGGDVDMVRQLQALFNFAFSIDEKEAQVLYAKILLGEVKNRKDAFELVLEESKTLPSPKIIQARYTELFAGDQFRAEHVAAFQEIVKNASF